MVWSEINHKLDLFAGDPEPTDEATARLFPESLRIEAWNWAQRLFCTHSPRARVATATVDTGQRSLVIPTDFYAIEGILDSDNERWWWPMERHPGDIRPVDDNVFEYWIWGDKMYLEDEVLYDSQDLQMFYWAYWPEVEYTSTSETNRDNVTIVTVTVTQPNVYVPKWAELALLHLTTASCMVPHEVFSSDVNQYKIRVESGTPLHNPRMQSAVWHLDMYERLVDKVPPKRSVEVQ